MFKSAAFIDDSDDDEEADAAFFAREKELRAEMQALATKHGSVMLGTGTKKRKRKANGKGKEVEETISQEIEMGESQVDEADSD